MRFIVLLLSYAIDLPLPAAFLLPAASLEQAADIPLVQNAFGFVQQDLPQSDRLSGQPCFVFAFGHQTALSAALSAGMNWFNWHTKNRSALR